MKVAIGRSSERFAANLEQLKKESARQIKRSYDSIVTIKDFLSKTESIGESKRYTSLVSKFDSVEKRLSTFEESLNDRVGKLIREYDKLKSEVDAMAKERNIYKALYDLSMDITSKRDLGDVLPSIIQTTAKILSCDNAVLRIVDDGGAVLFQYNWSSKNGAVKKSPSFQIFDAVLSTGNIVSLHFDENPVESVVCLPLCSGDDTLGIIYFSRKEQAFEQNDFELLRTISDKIAVTVESNRLFSDLEESRQSLVEDLREKYDFDEIIGNSPEMARVLATVADVAESESAVLIEGNSGTGKELLARAIHFNSLRKNNPFVTINCGAIPETLLESELFGYEKGAFTGAVQTKPGKFELADGGTILLDEIGELPPILQVKLLRFLQSGEFEPLGSTSVRHADVRILSATNRDLMKMVEAGEFRDDLYYRIHVIAIKLPALASRKGDIEILANYFLKMYAEKNSKNITGINDGTLNFLRGYQYPGNIRELENIIERAVVLCKGDKLTADDLPDHIVERPGITGLAKPSNASELKDLKLKLWKEVIEPVEREFVFKTLDECGGNISAAARQIGMHRKQFQRILKRSYGPDQKSDQG
ncbi:MAG: sigma 54-interacting transcriptional regulator [candidate division Zixibacteria bacterium]